VICVCAEKTFIQASATEKGFAPAFLITLDVYVKSTVRDKSNQAIKVLLGPKIRKNHRAVVDKSS
jgi:hypothetical protein